MALLPKKFALLIGNLPENDREIITRAYLFAKEKHQSQKRDSGEPYIVHPEAVAENLILDHFDTATIVAGLLHDAVEDTDTPLDEIREKFGSEIARIVDGVTKISAYKVKDKAKIFSDQKRFLDQVDNYRKLLLAAIEDPRVIIVKLYDRLDNIRTISWIPEHKQKFYARETIEVFAPIAERFGMGMLKGRLEDYAFPSAYPEEYQKFIDKLGNLYRHTDRFIKSIIPDLKRTIEQNGVKVRSIAGRAKFKYSLYTKYLRKGSLSSIYDIFALRIIVDSVEDCYKALGIVHSVYEPLPNEIDDYIAKPKDNAYRSIHTTVKDTLGNIFEVQIKTEEMHLMAEYGLGAHWNYKEKANSRYLGHKNAFEWVSELDKLGAISKRQFLTEMKERLFAHQIFVFTPSGEIVRLPEGSTPVDFAYYIHTDLGHRCTGAKINGRIMPLSTKLQTSDSVEIISSKTSNPSPDWLKFIKTASARHKISNFIKQRNESAMIALGQTKYEAALVKYGLEPLNRLLAEKIVSRSRLPYKNFDKCLAALGENDLGVVKLLKVLYPHFTLTEERALPALTNTTELKIPALKSIAHEFAKCCKPTAGDNLIGYLGREPVIKIHKKSCRRLKTADPRRLIPLI